MLADRVHANVGGSRISMGLSLIFSVCETCGAIVADDRRHDEWHDTQEPDNPAKQCQHGKYGPHRKRLICHHIREMMCELCWCVGPEASDG